MKQTQHAFMKTLLLSVTAMAATTVASAQYTNYFANQVFSNGTLTPTPQGTFNGGTFSIGNPSGATIATWGGQPGTLPSGAAFPTSGPTMLTLHSGGSSKTITVTPSTPLTPADHIYIQDLDNSESCTFRFYDAASTLITTTGFRATAISSGLNSDYSMTKNSTSIAINGGANLQSEPLLEIIPNTLVSYYTITFNNPNSGGSFGFYMGRNIPVLSQSISRTSIPRGHSATLTYTLGGINNNPIYQLGFTNNLPSGWKVAAVPATTGALGTFAAAANGATVALSAMNNSFSSASPLNSATWTVEVSNADGQMNGTCASNPAAFTNQASNFVVSGAAVSNNVSPTCLTVVAPLPLELTSFTAAPEACAATLRWETAYESQLAGYEIERSQDGERWTRIGRMQPGNKGMPQQYSFTDAQTPQGSLQYRLRILDLGGSAGFGPVASIRSACAESNGTFSIAPNPARGAFSCSFASMPAAGLQVAAHLSDLSGRQIATVTAVSLSGATARFMLPQLPAGLYILQATIDGQVAGTGKLLLQ